MEIAVRELDFTRSIRHDEGTEAAARASLRTQIARLEQRLGLLTLELWESGRARAPAPRQRQAAARLLSFGELEGVRDQLVHQIGLGERVLIERADSQARARAELEAMLADPHAHRFETIHRQQLGEPSCGAYRVVPRFGLLGMLFGWWCVKVSSGCP
ncbi:MAG: hypothetical protein ACJ764_12165 [Solirubrobacteraceae bacterium]